MKSSNTMLLAALRYARAGVPVIIVHGIAGGKCTCGRPCAAPGKHPVIQGGWRSATLDEQGIAHALEENPGVNLAIPTGAASGLLVVDIDAKSSGFSTLEEIERKNSPLPRGMVVKTGGGGIHIYLRHVPGARCSASRLGPGIDVRADGGYVVVPPSTHKSGQRYRWVSSCIPPQACPMPPEWFSACLNPAAPGPCPRPAGHRWEDVLNGIPEGRRNTTLTALVGHLLGHRVSPALANCACHAVNRAFCKPPLPDLEVDSVVRSISRTEARKGVHRG